MVELPGAVADRARVLLAAQAASSLTAARGPAVLPVVAAGRRVAPGDLFHSHHKVVPPPDAELRITVTGRTRVVCDASPIKTA